MSAGVAQRARRARLLEASLNDIRACVLHRNFPPSGLAPDLAVLAQARNGNNHNDLDTTGARA